jgi:signal transduction histidine kinase
MTECFVLHVIAEMGKEDCMTSDPVTHFAPAERADKTTLNTQAECIKALPWVTRFLDATATLALVLNSQRQIVFASRSFLKLIESCGDWPGDPIGFRPGEILHCLHSNESGGCGTTVFCRACGAVNAILQSQHGKEAIEECRLSRKNSKGEVEAMDLRVWARPLTLDGDIFTVFTVQDISSEKRRLVLERIFFHDIINTAGGVQGLAKLLAESTLPEESIRNIANLLCCSSDHLMEEIEAQRTLNSAERNDLVPHPDKVAVLSLLKTLTKSFAAHDVARGRVMEIDSINDDVWIETDAVLLRRVVLNLLKNALEASLNGEIVTLGLRTCNDGAHITLKNNAVMPESIRIQIFNRSFSTHGPGRGLGTYSARLLTERYLHGQIEFESTEGVGTVFTVILPKNWQESAASDATVSSQSK